MSDPFVAEVRIFAFNFAPAGWAECNGQLMSIQQNTALFSLLGTTYGGNGTTNFALPNIQGSVVMHPGQGSGLSLHDLGEQSGVTDVQLLASEIPTHTHAILARDATGNDNDVTTTAMVAKPPFGAVYGALASPSAMAPTAVTTAGGSQAHTNEQPYLVMMYCIALQGAFPPRE